MLCFVQVANFTKLFEQQSVTKLLPKNYKRDWINKGEDANG